MNLGKFDHSDGLFLSIADAWNNCLKNAADLKELIPEFFYLPEFLQNLNNFDFGIRQQDQQQVGDVILRSWSNNSPEEFIRNREALESNYVSEHLNEWIDLIFGYKQTGE